MPLHSKMLLLFPTLVLFLMFFLCCNGYTEKVFLLLLANVQVKKSLLVLSANDGPSRLPGQQT